MECSREYTEQAVVDSRQRVALLFGGLTTLHHKLLHINGKMIRA